METLDFGLESKSDIYNDHSYGLYQCASWEVSFYPELQHSPPPFFLSCPVEFGKRKNLNQIGNITFPVK